jgi:LmbE family N-acetylglucosaminyl deacetylase
MTAEESMLSVRLGLAEDVPLRILCLGAHSDDIEIGCGGTLLRLLVEHPGSVCHWSVFSGSAVRVAEGRRSADDFLSRAAEKTIQFFDFRDSFFPTDLVAIKEAFERLKAFHPNIIFTHHRDDRHQDHRIVSDLTYNTFRNHLVVEYEILKYDNDLGQPNLFAALPQEIGARKVSTILAHFQSQHARPWFTAETFYALMRVRGVHARSESGFAEAFYCRRLTL